MLRCDGSRGDRAFFNGRGLNSPAAAARLALHSTAVARFRNHADGCRLSWGDPCRPINLSSPWATTRYAMCLTMLSAIEMTGRPIDHSCYFPTTRLWVIHGKAGRGKSIQDQRVRQELDKIVLFRRDRFCEDRSQSRIFGLSTRNKIADY